MVNIGDLDVSGNQITVEALIYYDKGLNVVSKHTGPDNVNYLLRPITFELTTFVSGNSGPTKFLFMVNPFTFSRNQWYHIAGTYDGKYVKYYVDGCLVIDTPWSGNLYQNDLITCIEVVEHMPELEAQKAIANFCQHSDDILFSSTPFDYREATHFNVHPPEYWAELFARQGFLRDVDFEATFLTPWAVRFRRTQPPLPRLVRERVDRVEQEVAGEQLAQGPRELVEAAEAFNQAIADLSALRKRLAATERIAARREIARRVAHEIKNPLAPIRAAVETLRRLRARNDPAFDEYFDEATRTVLDEVSRISNIVQEFTRFARLPPPNPAPIDIVEAEAEVARREHGEGQGEGRAESRFDALHGEHLTPLVGREHELGILLERWAWARDGDGQVVLLAGEPGIGKSRLIRTLRERLGDEPHTALSHYSLAHAKPGLHGDAAADGVRDAVPRCSDATTDELWHARRRHAGRPAPPAPSG